MLNQFGKFSRKLRIDNGELLKDMADKLEVTSSYLSAVENGKRNVPRKWIKTIVALYDLEQSEIEELSNAVNQSQLDLKVNLQGFNKDDKNLMMAFAREFKELEDSDKVKIKNILKKRGRGDS